MFVFLFPCKKINYVFKQLLTITNVSTTTTIRVFLILHQHSWCPLTFSFTHRNKKAFLWRCKRKLCPPDEVATDRRHKGWDWEKCPIKKPRATSAPWTVQCIYQCHQARKATDIPEAWCGTWPLTCAVQPDLRRSRRPDDAWVYTKSAALCPDVQCQRDFCISSVCKKSGECGGGKVPFVSHQKAHS